MGRCMGGAWHGVWVHGLVHGWWWYTHAITPPPHHIVQHHHYHHPLMHHAMHHPMHHPMHSPAWPPPNGMHQPMHSPGCPSSQNQIRPHLTYRHRDYMILLLYITLHFLVSIGQFFGSCFYSVFL